MDNLAAEYSRTQAPKIKDEVTKRTCWLVINGSLRYTRKNAYFLVAVRDLSVTGPIDAVLKTANCRRPHLQLAAFGLQPFLKTRFRKADHFGSEFS